MPIMLIGVGNLKEVFQVPISLRKSTEEIVKIYEV